MAHPTKIPQLTQTPMKASTPECVLYVRVTYICDVSPINPEREQQHKWNPISYLKIVCQ